jgi:hypothetical protein
MYRHYGQVPGTAICHVDTYIKGSDRTNTVPLILPRSTSASSVEMTSNHVFDALIIYTTDTTITAPEDLQVSRPRGKWALLLSSLSNPSPGRTLDRVYTSLGKVLETQANRAAYGLGFGPHVVAQKIKSYFGNAKERVQHLELLRSSFPDKLEKNYWRLMKYTLPCVFHFLFEI